MCSKASYFGTPAPHFHAGVTCRDLSLLLVFIEDGWGDGEWDILHLSWGGVASGFLTFISLRSSWLLSLFPFFLSSLLTGHYSALLWGVRIWNKPDSHTKLCRCQGSTSWTTWLRMDCRKKTIGDLKPLKYIVFHNYIFSWASTHLAWLSLNSMMLLFALLHCLFCLSFRTIICKLQFLVLVYMQRLHWFN